MIFTCRTYRKAYERALDSYRAALIGSSISLGRRLAMQARAEKALTRAARIKLRAHREGINL